GCMRQILIGRARLRWSDPQVAIFVPQFAAIARRADLSPVNATASALRRRRSWYTRFRRNSYLARRRAPSIPRRGPDGRRAGSGWTRQARMRARARATTAREMAGGTAAPRSATAYPK